MAPTSSTGSTPSGSATLIGLAILENPCMPPDQPMTVHFDAQFYLAPDHTAVASLRYYNNTRIDFESNPDAFPAQYMICASVCCQFIVVKYSVC